MIPWSLTFSTSRFGTYPNGSFGPILLFLTPFLIFSIIRLIKDGLIFSPDTRIRLILVFAPLLTFLGVGSVIGLLYFRYSLAAFVTFVIGATALIDQLKFKNVKPLHTQFACLSLTLFLVLVGARSNYGVTGGIGDEIFSGEVSEDEFKNRLTHGVDDYLNEVLEKDENVISYIFFPINRIKNEVYFVSTKTSLFGQVLEPESFGVFTKKHKIRYAIVNNSNIPEFLNTAGFFGQVFRDEGLVYGSGNYAIYDLWQGGRGNWLKHSLFGDELNDKIEVSANPDEWLVREFPIDKKVELVRGKVKVVTKEEKSSLLVNLVEYDANNRELRQEIPAKELLREVEDELKFVFKPLNDTTKVKIIVHPWREVDGSIFVLEGEVYFKMGKDK